MSAPARPRKTAAQRPQRKSAGRSRLTTEAEAKPPADIDSTPIRDWLTARPGRPVLAGAAAILALQLVLRGWLDFRGFFYLDDFAFTGRAATMSVTDPHYLLLSYNNHVMPGSFAWVWVLTRLAPLSFGPVVVVDLGLQLVLGVVFYRLLRALFGTRPAILVPFAIGMLSPITLPAFLWWAAALNQLPEQIAMVAALLYHVRYLRSGRVRTGVLGAVSVAVGLLFSEKSLFIVPLVVGFTVLYGATGTPWRRVVTLARRHVRVWIAYLVVVVPYTAYYLTEVPSPTRPGADGAALGQLVTQSFAHAILPGLLGGPWTWTPIGVAGALAGPTAFAETLALALFAAIVVLTFALHRRALLGWWLALGYAAMNLTVLAVSRATFVGPVIGDEYRYVTDVAIVAAIGGALSVLQIAGPWANGGPQPLVVRPKVHAWWNTSRMRELRTVLPHPGQGLVAGVLVVAFLVSATVSSLRYDQYWRVNPARPYLTTLRAQLAIAPPDLVLADQNVPAEVAWALLGQYALPSRILGPLPDHPAFLEPGGTTSDLRVIDRGGRIQPAAIYGITATPGQAKNCGWRMGALPVTIPMRRPTDTDGPATARIGYIASADTTGEVTIGTTRLTVPFHRGLGTVWFRTTGQVASVQVSALADDTATVCTNDISVGIPVPTGGQS
jgi:hypothetical protein